MKKEIKLTIPKDYFKSLKFKINWDWDLYFKTERLAILEKLLKFVRSKKI